MARKRHHYVPKAYLKFFCAADGKLHVYLKDEPGRSFQQAPDATAFHKYYYSQPLPHVRKDHDALENFFSALEAKWPPLVERMQRRVNINDALTTSSSSSPCSGRAYRRCAMPPSARRPRHSSRHCCSWMPWATAPKPEGRPDIREHVEFAIDPHHSCAADLPKQQ